MMLLHLYIFSGKYSGRHETTYRDYPEWATYLAFAVLAFVVFVLWKGKRNNKPKNKK